MMPPILVPNLHALLHCVPAQHPCNLLHHCLLPVCLLLLFCSPPASAPEQPFQVSMQKLPFSATNHVRNSSV